MLAAFGPGNVLAGLDDCAGPGSPIFLAVVACTVSWRRLFRPKAAPENIDGSERTPQGRGVMIGTLDSLSWICMTEGFFFARFHFFILIFNF